MDETCTCHRDPSLGQRGMKDWFPKMDTPEPNEKREKREKTVNENRTQPRRVNNNNKTKRNDEK